MPPPAGSIVILGGYGATGGRIARLLAARGAGPLVIAGRNGERAVQTAAGLVAAHPGADVRAAAVDAADGRALRAALTGARLVVVASSTTALAGRVAEAALDAGADYLDTQLSFAGKHRDLEALRPRIERAGRVFVTDGGFHPGLPAVLVRRAAALFPDIEEAYVGSVIQVDWRAAGFSPSTARELIDEVREHAPRVYRDGAWTDAGYRPRFFHFEPPWGRRPTYAMHLREMEDLPVRVPTLRGTGFFAGGFDPVTDVVVLPAVATAARALGRGADALLARILAWSLRRGSRPPFGTVLQLSVRRRDEQAFRDVLTIAHEDAYDLTAIPVVATILQMDDDARRRPGLSCQASFLDPARLLADMAAMGVSVRVKCSNFGAR